MFPAVEDFGIMPVEAMAAGAPVLARAEGGVAESVVPGVTGALIGFDSSDEIREGAAVALATARSTASTGPRSSPGNVSARRSPHG